VPSCLPSQSVYSACLARHPYLAPFLSSFQAHHPLPYKTNYMHTSYLQITVNSLKIFLHFIFTFIVGHPLHIATSCSVATTSWLLPDRVVICMVFIYSAVCQLVLSALVDTSRTVPWTHTTTTALLNLVKMAISFYDIKITSLSDQKLAYQLTL